MKTGDWINLATAIGVAVTAAFTAFAFITVRRQGRISQPVLNSSFSGHPYRQHILLSIGIQQPESDRYVINQVKIKRPRNAKISAPRYVRDATGGMEPTETDIWSRSLSFDQQRTNHVSMFVDAPRGTELSLQIKTALKSDPRVTSRLIHHAKMAD